MEENTLRLPVETAVQVFSQLFNGPPDKGVQLNDGKNTWAIGFLQEQTTGMIIFEISHKPILQITKG